MSQTADPTLGRAPGSPTSQPAWQALLAHHAKIGQVHLHDLFAADPQHGQRLTLEAAGLYLDYSKNRINEQTLALLAALATECGLHARIDAMFRGDLINATEQRSVLHVALRAYDSVVVIQAHQLAQLQMPRQRCRLSGHPVHEIPVADNGPGAMIDGSMVIAVITCGQVRFGDGHADRIG